MLRVVYMGTPEFAVPALQALASRADVEVCLVVSQPDRPAGRGGKLKSPAVIEAARAAGLPTWQPESLKPDEAFATLRDVPADLYVVAAYGEILRQRVLDLPRLGALNIHGSLLARWRGAAPIQWSIASGDPAGGVAIMKMERGLDTGPVYAMHARMIAEDMTAGELHDALSLDGARLLMDTLPAVLDGATPAAQDASRATYARMLTAADRSLRPDMTAAQIAWWVNGMSPWPGVTMMLGEEPLALLRARPLAAMNDAPPWSLVEHEQMPCVVGADQKLAALLEVRRPGRRTVDGRSWLNGERMVGQVLRPVP